MTNDIGLDERWRPISGFARYEVSDLGRVKSHCGRRAVRILKPVIRDGYGFVKLGRDHDLPIHHLVLETFVGPRPAEMECRHLDGCRSNNRLSNLVWGTKSENYADRRGHGTANDGERHGHAKLTNDLVLAIYNSDLSDLEASQVFGVARKVVARIRFGQAWQGITGAPQRKPGQRRGEDNVRAKLVEGQVLAIRSSLEPRRVLAERYGVSVNNIAMIQSGRTWRHL